MTDLSPAANAVLNAYMDNCGWLDGPLQRDYQCVAAVLRASVNQVVPDQQEPASSPHMGNFISNVQWRQSQAIRTQLLAIADELEAIDEEDAFVVTAEFARQGVGQMTHPQASSKKHDPKGGNCTHTAWVKNGRVFLSNDDDGYYQQDFKNREELQAFVDHLWQIADEAWPKQSDDLLERLRNAYQCCKSCGTTYGVYSVGCSSSRIGKCDVCDAQTWVTETRDYAYLITGIRRVETARKSAG